MKYLFALVLGLCLAAPVIADTRALLQLIDYVGVDYSEAVAEGDVIDQGEYAEMEEFASRITTELAALDHPEAVYLAAIAADLRRAIAAKADPATIADLTLQLRQPLMADTQLPLLPQRLPDLTEAAALYQSRCALCHGDTGGGDGPTASGLDPAPTDFRDRARARQRSLFGLYNTITLGVDGTAMPPFPQLSDSQRWSLAFYVGSLFGDGSEPSVAPLAGEELMRAVTLTAPAEWERNRHGPAETALWYREHPAQLFTAVPDSLLTARRLLAASWASYRAGDVAAARSQAITAYLEGFELAEAALQNVNPALMRTTETALMAYRQDLNDRADEAVIAERFATADALLIRAKEALGDQDLAPSVAFTSSLVILLREGLEAILVLAAMMAFLIRTGRRDGLPYVHVGWVAALAAGGATWAVSTYVIAISGAAREVTEGFTALLAAAVLFYVGFWMHGGASAQRRGKFLQDKLQSALGKRTLWTLSLLAFLTVYREVFETVLFYQALGSQVGPDSQQAVVGGAIVAAVILVAVTWLLARFGVRLPLRQFFLVGSYLMIVLAMIFAGKGVAALQEAGRVSLTPMAGPRVDWLGLYPTWESLGLQVTLLALAALLMWRHARRPS